MEEVVLEEVVPQHEAEGFSREVMRMVIIFAQTAHGFPLFLPPIMLTNASPGGEQAAPTESLDQNGLTAFILATEELADEFLYNPAIMGLHAEFRQVIAGFEGEPEAYDTCKDGKCTVGSPMLL